MFCGKKRKSELEGLPPGQQSIPSILKWGIEHPGITRTLPNIDRDSWALEVDGEVRHSLKLTFRDLLDMSQFESVSDFHCVEGWSVLEQKWSGVLFRTLLEKVDPKKEAKYVLFASADGYTTSLPIEELLGDDILIAHRLNGEDLPQPLGGPVRLVVPKKYAYKSPMWITRITFSASDKLGYWERGYYSNSADVWKSERYR